MKIYTITHKNFAYDSYLGHVIVANSIDEVIQKAKEGPGEEGADVWHNATVEEQGQYTGTKTEPFILLSDFRSG